MAIQGQRSAQSTSPAWGGKRDRARTVLRNHDAGISPDTPIRSGSLFFPRSSAASTWVKRSSGLSTWECGYATTPADRPGICPGPRSGKVWRAITCRSRSTNCRPPSASVSGIPHDLGIGMTARAVALSIVASLTTSTSSFADIQPDNCARAANYSENKRGFSMLVIQNGRTVFEHYANGGSADSRCKIFSGTKSFWGIAALCAARDGLIKLDEHVADT